MKDYTDAAYDAAMQLLHGKESPFRRDWPLPSTAVQLAKIIDRAAKLPEKHAALLLAQNFIDEWDRYRAGLSNTSQPESLLLLRTALSKLR